jgi:hypothetical protein
MGACFETGIIHKYNYNDTYYNVMFRNGYFANQISKHIAFSVTADVGIGSLQSKYSSGSYNRITFHARLNLLFGFTF